MRIGQAALCSGALLVAACGSSSEDEAKKPAGSERREHIYATIMGADEVIAIDGESRAILRHISIGQSPAILLGTPDHKKLYSANWGDDTLSAIDIASEAVHSIPMDGRPWVEAMSPDGKFVYAGVGSNKIEVVSTESDSVVRSIAFDTLPASVAVSPDGNTLYVAHLSGNTLEAVSAATGDVIHPGIGVGLAPAWITISPDGGTVYTLNFLTGDVTIVDTASFAVTGTVSAGADSAGIVGNVSPDGKLLCVTDYGTLDVAGIDTQTKRLSWTFPTAGRPVGIGFSPDGARGYAGDYGPDSLAVTPADLIQALVKMTTLRPTGTSQITVFDPKTGYKLGEPVAVGPGPSSIVVIPL
jgi:YVTN family beta-propeller protein